MIKHPFYIGQWQATPTTNSLRLGDSVKQLEPKAMDVLLLLCQRKGEVLSADEIADSCWGNTHIGDNPVHKAITQLRKALGDKASAPTYIETIRKRGYQIIADVSFPLEPTTSTETETWQGGSPFPGLSAFETTDANVFFGRNEQIAILLNRLSKRIEHKRAFTLILGPSGTGKSSLVNAGVLPKLMNSRGYDGIRVESHVSLDLADVTQGRLLLDLAGVLLDWDVKDIPVFDGLSADDLAKQLTANIDSVIQRCQKACELAQNGGSGLIPLLSLFVDRLEILLSSPLYADQDRTQLLSIIEKLANSGSVVVFSACRNDFYPLVVNQPSLMSGKAYGSHFDLTPPTHADLSQMIRLPAAAANLAWSKDEASGLPLDEILATEATNNPDALPMLQYTLQELYLQRSESDELLTSVYKTLGGIEGAIGKKAEEIHQQLPQSHQQELAYVLSLLVTLNPDGKSITSRAARWSQLSTQSQKDFVQAMVDSRLFVSHLQNEEPCFSVAHEALLRRWPRASEWIIAHRESLTTKRQLQDLAQRWLKEDKNRAYLLADGKPLQEALTLRKNSAFTLEVQELELIKASNARAKTKRWAKRAIVALLCMLTFTSVLMSYKSQQSEYLAQQKRLEAESLLGFMVGEFADKLRSVRRMDLLDGISNKALEYFSQQEQQPSGFSLLTYTHSEENFKARFQHAQTLGAMGEVAYSRNKNNEAKQAFVSANAILDNLQNQQPDNLELLKTIGANAFWQGQLAMDAADFIEAKAFFERYLLYSQNMISQDPNNPDNQLELSYSYMAIGSSNTKLQQHAIARNAFLSALDIQYKLVEGLPIDDIAQIDIADTLEWLAESEEQLGYLQVAVKTREEAQAIVNRLLVIHKDSADLLENLAYSYFNNANILYYLGNYTAANQAILNSINYFNQMLAQDNSNQVWQLQLIAAQALQHYLAKITDSETLVSQIKAEDFEKLLSKAEKAPSLLSVYIKGYQLNNQWNLSQKAINLAIPKLEKLLEKQPENTKLLFSLSNIYLTAAKQIEYFQANNNQAKKMACLQVINLLQPTISVSSSFELLLPYVQAHHCLDRPSQVQHLIDRLDSMHITQYQF
ncbi:transcriptional regulator [Alteromonadaceae bacterium M269]|nr:transcriptional regulator [Alteromonadaceae bacterium M269]